MDQVLNLSDNEKMAIVCLFFARLQSDDSRYKGYTEVLKKISKKYGVKYSSLKNNKDRFDAVYNTGRKGWHQKSLAEQNKFLSSIYEQYKHMSIEELEVIVNAINREVVESSSNYFSIKTKDPQTVDQ